jgi:hypothetical protein
MLSLSILCSGCKKKETEEKPEKTADTAKPAVDLSLSVKLLDKIAVRIEKVAEHPEFGQAIEQLVDRATTHPTLAAAGEVFFSRLGADPALAMPAQAFVNKLTNSKVMQAFVFRIMSENPGKSPEQLGEIVGAKVDKILTGPIWDKAIGSSLDRLMKLPKVDASFGRLADKLVSGVQFEKRLAEIVDPLIKNPEVTAAITALNDGKPLGDAADIQRLADKVFTEKRLLNLLVGFCRMKTLSDGLGAEFAKLVNSPQFPKSMAPNLARIIADPGVEKKALELFEILLSGSIDSAKLDKTLQGVFEQPVVAKELVAIIDGLSTNKQFIEDIRSAFLAAVKSPEFAKVLLASMKAG